MQVCGIHNVIEPFLGNGFLTINGFSTDNLRGRSIALIVEQLKSLSHGVQIDFIENRFVFTSDRDFTIGGNQDVLDVIGIPRTEEA